MLKNGSPHLPIDIFDLLRYLIPTILLAITVITDVSAK